MKSNILKCEHCQAVTSIASIFQSQCCSIFLCHSCFLHHTCSLIISNKDETECGRCSSAQAIIICKQCNSEPLCFQCDKKVHRTDKFSLHCRSEYVAKQNCHNAQSNPYLLEQPSGKSWQQQKNLTATGMKQIWEKVIVELQQKFNEVINQLVDKKKQIVHKIQKRRNRQLQNYRQIATQFQDLKQKYMMDGNLKKSQILDKFQVMKKKMENLQSQYAITNDRKLKITVANSQFDSIKGLVERLDVKALIVKVNSQPQKSKLRSSMVFTSSPSNKDSDLYRTPRQNKQKLSLSTIENQYKDGFERVNQEEQRQKNYGKSFRLEKVRSQKVFRKNSGNIKISFQDKFKKNVL